MDQYSPIPNQFTVESKVEIATELDDGRKVWRMLTQSEFRQWQKDGGDLEDLIEDDE